MSNFTKYVSERIIEAIILLVMDVYNILICLHYEQWYTGYICAYLSICDYVFLGVEFLGQMACTFNIFRDTKMFTMSREKECSFLVSLLMFWMLNYSPILWGIMLAYCFYLLMSKYEIFFCLPGMETLWPWSVWFVWFVCSFNTLLNSLC